MKLTEIVVVGTGADLAVELGFIPDFVEVVNATTRTGLLFSALDTVNTKGIAVAAAGTRTAAAAGVVVSDTDDAIRGFTLAAAATVNVSANPLLVKAGMYDYV